MVSTRSFKIYAMHSTGKLSGSWAVRKLITFIDQWCMNWIYNLFVWPHLHFTDILIHIHGNIYKKSHTCLKNNKTVLITLMVSNLYSSSLWLFILSRDQNHLSGFRWNVFIKILRGFFRRFALLVTWLPQILYIFETKTRFDSYSLYAGNFYHKYKTM